tara:strand:+ start:49 stop:210 length:162 start_codon:yes stop_codon:yes gene_type:complete
MRKIISKLPDRFKWTIHNVIAHPFSEIAFQLGFEKSSKLIHDNTLPIEEDNEF